MNVFIALFLILFCYYAWRWPSRAVVLTAALLPTYLLRFTVMGLPTNVFEVIVVMTTIITLSKPAIRQQWQTAWQKFPRSFAWLVALFVVATIISTVISTVPRVSLGILKGWIIIPLLLGWLVYVESEVRNRELRILRSSLLSGVVTASLSLFFWRPGQRLAGIYDVPNSLALWLAPLIVMTAWSLLVRQNYLTQSERKFWMLMLLPTAVALLLTQSVMGIMTVIISITIGALCWLPRRERQRTMLRLGVAAVIILITFLGTGRMTYFMQPLRDPKAHSSWQVRQQLWSISEELIREHPLLGIGLGQFEPHYQRKLHERFQDYMECEKSSPRSPSDLPESNVKRQRSKVKCIRPLPEWVFRDPHNWLLSFWLNTGVLGLVSFIGLNLYAVRHAIRHGQALSVRCQMLLLALLSLGLFGLTDTIFWKNDLSALHFIVLALLLQNPDGTTQT